MLASALGSIYHLSNYAALDCDLPSQPINIAPLQPQSAACGQPVTFTAKINSETGTVPRDGEMVTFNRGATPLGTAVLHSGSAQLTTSALGINTTQIRATYAGDPHLPASTSAAVAQVVNKAPTATALISSLNPSVYGQSVTLTATVTARFGGTPNGSVTFKDGTNALATVYCSGKSTFVTSKLMSGSHSMRRTMAIPCT